MAIQHSFGLSSLVLASTLLLDSCSGAVARSVQNERTANEDQLAAVLLSGDELQARRLTDEVVAGKRTVGASLLTDERSLPRNIVLRTTVDGRDWQLGVDDVSEYALCVLELKDRTSSEEILTRVAPSLRSQCTTATRPKSGGCEICNSQAFPVSGSVKSALVGYWRSRLAPENR